MMLTDTQHRRGGHWPSVGRTMSFSGGLLTNHLCHCEPEGRGNLLVTRWNPHIVSRDAKMLKTVPTGLRDSSSKVIGGGMPPALP